MTPDRTHELILIGRTPQSESIRQALLERFPQTDICLVDACNEADIQFEVTDIHRDAKGIYHLHSSNGQRLSAQRLVVSIGSSTLLLAHRMGYGRHLCLFPVTGEAPLQQFTPCLSANRTSSILRWLQSLGTGPNLFRNLAGLLGNKNTRQLLLAGLKRSWKKAEENEEAVHQCEVFNREEKSLTNTPQLLSTSQPLVFVLTASASQPLNQDLLKQLLTELQLN
ncbi:hypothetical protein [Marinospirillum alkaliphilum]|uniref:Uncharacterized protein n=1 Tax=Marinospirillum alkaliphilum DSM 21637 TaxID=1122209 RepID=A0A1K1VEY0_9GAMM|nr:hypothetical protein [Marinospirillum alkaliphilum]SFX23267.1 hypothetical protein SAMN02745752_00918 [Marinospirillum alkaliphilum DSM 21637]